MQLKGEDKVFKKISRATVFSVLISTLLTGCGGDDGIDNTPVDVSKTVSTFDLTPTAALHVQQLTTAGAVVKSSRCYRSASPDVIIGPPPVMFVYEIRTSDLPAATGAGFQANASRDGFRATSVPCVTAEGVPSL